MVIISCIVSTLPITSLFILDRMFFCSKSSVVGRNFSRLRSLQQLVVICRRTTTATRVMRFWSNDLLLFIRRFAWSLMPGVNSWITGFWGAGTFWLLASSPCVTLRIDVVEFSWTSHLAIIGIRLLLPCRCDRIPSTSGSLFWILEGGCALAFISMLLPSLCDSRDIGSFGLWSNVSLRLSTILTWSLY